MRRHPSRVERHAAAGLHGDAVGREGRGTEVNVHHGVTDVLKYQIGARLVGRHDGLRAGCGGRYGCAATAVDDTAGGGFGFYVRESHSVFSLRFSKVRPARSIGGFAFAGR